MGIKVNRGPIDLWIDRNGPDGLVKLAQKAGVSSSLMMKVRNGYVPTKASSRIKISSALSVSEDELFPIAPTRRKAA